jgi:hypothetical protein
VSKTCACTGRTKRRATVAGRRRTAGTLTLVITATVLDNTKKLTQGVVARDLLLAQRVVEQTRPSAPLPSNPLRRPGSGTAITTLMDGGR